MPDIVQVIGIALQILIMIAVLLFILKWASEAKKSGDRVQLITVNILMVAWGFKAASLISTAIF